MPMPTAYNDRAQAFFDRYEAQDATPIKDLLSRWIPAGAHVLELGFVMPMPTAYNDRAQAFFDRYEAQDATPIKDLLSRWIPAGAHVLELGCGSGRDARFLAQLGANVIATDGSESLLALARQHTDPTLTNLQFAPLALPPGRDARFLAQLGANVIATDGSESLLALARQHTDPTLTNLQFAPLALPPSPTETQTFVAQLPTTTHQAHAVYTCGVLQHLTDHELHETVRFIDHVTDEQGLVIVVVPLNHRGEPDRPTYSRERYDYIQRFERVGFRLANASYADDVGTPGFTCTWATFVFLRETGSQRANQRFRRILENDANRLANASYADDVGTPGFTCTWATFVFLRETGSQRANQRFRRILENDAKTTTYKLALLRALCDINRTMPRLVRFEGDEALIPVGLIVERWVRDYWQLAQGTRLPRQIHQGRKLGFETSLQTLMTHCAQNYSVFETLLNQSTRDVAVTQAITTLFDDVETTLFKGPIHYITEDGHPIFHRARRHVRKLPLTDQRSLFTRYGELAFPAFHRARRHVRKLPLTDQRSLFTRYGELAFPAELWLELTRIAPWLEDSIVLEWAKLSARFESLETNIQTPLTMADIVVRHGRYCGTPNAKRHRARYKLCTIDLPSGA